MTTNPMTIHSTTTNAMKTHAMTTGFMCYLFHGFPHGKNNTCSDNTCNNKRFDVFPFCQKDGQERHYGVLSCVAVCCSVLQCVAVCCSVWQCVAVCRLRASSWCAFVCCSVLQCVAVCCSALQCVAVCCSVLQCVAV